MDAQVETIDKHSARGTRRFLNLKRGVGFTWVKIARVFRVSRWTKMRRVHLIDLEHLSRFSTITDEEIDGIIRDFMSTGCAWST